MMDKHLWITYYEAALDEGCEIDEAADFADAAIRDDMAAAIDAAEGDR